MPSSFAVESLRCMKLSMHLLAKSSCGDCIVAKHDGFHIVEGQDVKADYCSAFATPFHAPLLQRSMADCHTLTI